MTSLSRPRRAAVATIAVVTLLGVDRVQRQLHKKKSAATPTSPAPTTLVLEPHAQAARRAEEPAHRDRRRCRRRR